MESESSISTANAPFDSNTPSDIVLRSTDGVDFFVLRAFIEHSLEGLAGLFGAHTFAEETRDGFPVAPLPEKHDVLHTMLTLCYPGPPVSFHNILHILAVEEALEKYCCNNLVIESFRNALLVSNVAKVKPDEVFLIGARRRWKDVCTASAKNSLTLSTCTSFYGRTFVEEEIKGSSAYHFSCLMNYHQSCRDVAAKAALELRNFARSPPGTRDLIDRNHIPDLLVSDAGHTSNCLAKRQDVAVVGSIPFSRQPRHLKVPTWFFCYLDDIGKKFQDSPCEASIMDLDLMRERIHNAKRDCPQCAINSVHMIFDLHKFLSFLASRIQERVTEVSLNINFPE